MSIKFLFRTRSFFLSLRYSLDGLPINTQGSVGVPLRSVAASLFTVAYPNTLISSQNVAGKVSLASSFISPVTSVPPSQFSIYSLIPRLRALEASSSHGRGNFWLHGTRSNTHAQSTRGRTSLTCDSLLIIIRSICEAARGAPIDVVAYLLACRLSWIWLQIIQSFNKLPVTILYHHSPKAPSYHPPLCKVAMREITNLGAILLSDETLNAVAICLPPLSESSTFLCVHFRQV